MFACIESSFDCFVEDASLDVVLNREVQLLLADEPVAPLLLEVDDV